MIFPTFQIKKAIEASQYLINKNDGLFDIYKLNKILYIAERNSWVKWGKPFIGDSLFSLPLGPVLSKVCDLVGGSNESPLWNEHIKKINKNNITNIKNKQIDVLNKRELKLLDALYEKFKDYSFGQMKDYCHNLPEWENPRESSKYIPIENLLKTEGKTKEEIEEIENEIVQIEYIKKSLSC